MQTAALFLFLSACGISFGWQPMPDGTDSYEYTVQLDRDLLARLERGESIPVSLDIPEEVQPIRRIRIVAGNRELPQQLLVTRMKPETNDKVPESSDSQDVVRGQYDGRYNNSNNSGNILPRYSQQDILPVANNNQQQQGIVPRGRQLEAEVQNFARSLQRTADQTRNAVEQDILPKARQILPQGSGDILPRQSGNQGSIKPRQSVASNNISPRSSAPRYSGGVQNASSSSEADIRQLFGDDQNRSQSTIRPANRNGASVSPPPRTAQTSQTGNGSPAILPSSSTSQSQPTNNNSRQQNRTTDGRYPTGAGSSQDRNPSNELRPFSDQQQQQDIQARWLNRQQAQPSSTGNQLDSPAKRYATATLTNSNSPQTKNNQSNQRSNTTLTFPADGESNGSQASSMSQQGKIPEIRQGMLENPANAPLTTGRGTQQPNPQIGSQKNPAYAPPQRDTNQLRNFASNTNQHEQAGMSASSRVANTQQIQQGMTPVQPAPSQVSSGATVFPLILAWVLFSGSFAGNVYSVWSYLDLRSKYRGLVRSAGRKLGRRYLDDRYGEDKYEYEE